MSISIMPMTESHVTDAATVLQQWYRTECSYFPLLPTIFEDISQAETIIHQALKQPHTYGVVAIDDDRIVGYMISSLNLVAPDSPWAGFTSERSMISNYGWHAVEIPETYAMLYASIAAHWLDHGCLTHIVVMPTTPQVLEVWYSLGFGQTGVHGMRSLDGVLPPEIEGYSIRAATPEDAPFVQEMEHRLFVHVNHAPTFIPYIPEAVANYLPMHAQRLHDARWKFWMAEDANEPLGIIVMQTPDKPIISEPENSPYIAKAFVLPQTQQRGIGAKLATYAMAEAQQLGYQGCSVGWEPQNRSAAHLWSKMGFKPYYYQLTRRLDTRLLWARLFHQAPHDRLEA